MALGFWSGKRIFLTGHTGFKGSWLSLWLEKAGANLVGYALDPPTQPSLFELGRVNDGMRSLSGDVCDRDRLLAAVREHHPEIVFHLAAQPLVRDSYQRPVETFAVNVLGTAHLLEAVRATPGVRAVVIVTSDKCYENRESIWGYREGDPMGGHDPYSASKGCAELVAASYRRSFFPDVSHAQHGVALATVRAGNVIGGGDWAHERLVPDAIRAFSSGNTLLIRNPRAVRPWQHVLEPLQGYLLLARRLYEEGPALAGAWNFGPTEGDARPVEEVVSALVRLWGGSASWQTEGGAQPHEAHSLRLDCSKARLQLGWKPRLDLDAALGWVVDWAKARERGEDVRRLCLRDIERFEGMVR